MKMSRVVALVSVLLVIAACGGGASGASTTIPADGTTTDVTSPSDQTTVADDPGTVTNIDDMPAECIEAFSAFLQEIEPIVQDVDFENSTMTDLEEMGTALEPATTAFEAETANCPDLDLSDEEAIAFMMEIAERDAPGTAAYFAWLEEFMTAADDGAAAVSGDCETDIAALQAYVDQGGTMSDLTMGEITAVGSLMTALSTECSPERFQEWVSQEDVAAFIGG
jgi:hypothetical protein